MQLGVPSGITQTCELVRAPGVELLRPAREITEQLNPNAIHQLCVLATMKHISELIDIHDEGDDVEWDEDPYDNLSQTVEKSAEERIALITFDNANPDFAKSMRELCVEFEDIFRETVHPEPAAIPPMEIDVDIQKWHSAKAGVGPRKQSTVRGTVIREHIQNNLACNVIKTVDTDVTHYSQVHLVPKPTAGQWRLVLDYVRLNACTRGKEGWPIPNIKELIQRVGSKRPNVYGTMDLTAGYHQAPLAKSAQIYTAFVTMQGIFCWQRVPMGLKGAGAYYQRVMASVVLLGWIYSICELYLDDVLIFAKTNEEFLSHLRRVFERFRKHKLAVNPKKCFFGFAEIEYVGHTFSSEGVSYSETKKGKVLDFPLPHTHTSN